MAIKSHNYIKNYDTLHIFILEEKYYITAYLKKKGSGPIESPYVKVMNPKQIQSFRPY